MKLLKILVVTLVLSGCAAVAEPEVPGLKEQAQAIVAITEYVQKCQEAGILPTPKELEKK